MHLLVAQSGTIDDGSEPRDLEQTPGDIVVLSSAESELMLLAEAHRTLAAEEPQPALRLANLMQLKHHFSVDLYAEKTLSGAKIVVLRLLGGKSYWPYGVERLSELANDGAFQLIVLPGDDQPDVQLETLSTVDRKTHEALWGYLREGGPDNARGFLEYITALLNKSELPPPARPLLKAGFYHSRYSSPHPPACGGSPLPPGERARSLQIRYPALSPLANLYGERRLSGRDQQDIATSAHLGRGRREAPGEGGAANKAQAGEGECRPVAALIFYRALLQSGDLAAVDALLEALRRHGFDVLPIYVSSLRDSFSRETIRLLFNRAPPDIILNSTAFASTVADTSPFDGHDAMVLQVVFSGESEESWAAHTRGLPPHAIAMHVSLPEVDGRILTRAISFKSDSGFDEATQHYMTRNEPKADRVKFVADLAAAWIELRQTPVQKRKLALILANYPNKDSRLANGVGLDTPQSAIEILRALKSAGYTVRDIPADGNALIEALRDGPTNAAMNGRQIDEALSLNLYTKYFSLLPEAVQSQIIERWGPPEDDPFFADNMFAIPVLRFGNVFIGIQPARGYNIDPKATYHDPALVPPHSYFAFYIWLRNVAAINAAIHLGKHGNLEWLPGKALALSAECYPEAVLGPVPNIYPFIVNDPGEGSQAKRRTSAVIIDHLTPPMTRAETYGELKELEALVDEYYEAASTDETRRRYLSGEISATSARLGLDKDYGIDSAASETDALAALDNHLCELKEMQIRDGLHIFGKSPKGQQRTDLLVALARVPRGTDEPGNASLITALSADLGLESFNPLDCKLGKPWTGPRPISLAEIIDEPWRTNGDTVERLEILAHQLVANLADTRPSRGSHLSHGERESAPTPLVLPESWVRSRAVLDEIGTNLAPKLDKSGNSEITGLLTALNGRFVAPGPSGAPTRGRPDVLPTGRNFYSLDSRTLPTPAAWELGRKSAELVIERYVQDHGDWPRALALSAWGTANMRTGGDDIAQALALMGVKPQWEPASRRVTGFEIIPLAKLGRPRVDVTFRISGFFRDAFPAQIDLLDSAIRAVALLREPAGENPLAENSAKEAAKLVSEGLSPAIANRIASARIFGSKPGAYGAGLQTLIDEGIWETEADFAESYMQWGQYAYGAGLEGRAERGALERRLGGLDAILHNQDNREHDILDSDDYYQFEGGLAASVKALRGAPVRVYHNDHSRPERPVVRALEEEIGRVVRGRAANPKWIAGIMRHGYKGAFEIAATVDYLFAFAATTGSVGDHHFEALYDAYIVDDEVREFLVQNNDAALADIAARFKDALDRGLWRPQSNSAAHMLNTILMESDN